MQKVLIISYFFPPCNLTASQRTYAWAKYLPEYGYDPIVVTRNWDVPIESGIDMSRNSGTGDELIINENVKTWYMIYRGNIRDRVYVAFGDRKGLFLRRSLSFLELVLQNFIISHLSFHNIFSKSRELLKQDKTISKVVVSGNPFVQFQFCWRLKQEFPYIKWIADYRDDWTTSELLQNRSYLNRILHYLEQRSEQKWLSSASCFTATTTKGEDRISGLVKIPGHVVVNGYGDEVIQRDTILSPDKNRFVITYNGNLYGSQPIEFFLDAFKALVNKYEGKIQLKLQFPGLAYDAHQEARVRNHLKGYEAYVLITPRLPMKDVLLLQDKSNVLLLVGHLKLKGIAPSKMYEYIAFRKKILLCCNDHDVLEALLLETGLGIFADTVKETMDVLSTEIELVISGQEEKTNYNNEIVESYSRKKQVGKLAALLDSI